MKIHSMLAVSLMIVTFVLGLAGGYFISPSYQQTMYNKNEGMGLGKADQFVDLRYINQMIAHHTAAILLANQAAVISQREEIKNLAADIQKNEPKLIEELYGWKKAWYNDTQLVKHPSVPNLGNADDTSDLRFLNALIAHHEAGIEMTSEIRMKSTRTEVLNNADGVESFLSGGLVMLKEWRSDWYGVNVK